MTLPSFAQARAALAHGETSLQTLVSSFLERIEAENDRLGAFVQVEGDSLRSHARHLDLRRDEGDDRPLAGLVLGVKDTICIKGRPVTCGSRMLAEFESLYDATVVERLREAGAVFVGKTNCDEFAMGSSNETSYFGPVRHPHDPERVPGGSSGGSAAAVAAGLCHAALGSDTGGSIRQPAAFCGIVGLKPTYGRVSRYGLVAYASSFDTIGPMTHTVEDAAHILGAIAGHDPRDATSAPVAVPDYTASLTGSVRGVRIGLPRDYFAEGLDPEIERMIREVVARLEGEGAEIVEVEMPHTEYGIATYYVLATAEASSNLARYDGVRYGHRAEVRAVREALQSGEEPGESVVERLYAQTRTEGFGDEVKRRIMLGTYVLSSGYYDRYYGKAQRVRTLVRDDFDRAFRAADVLLTPATPTTAFRRGEKTDDPLAMYLSDVYTVTANLAGVPGLAVPIGRHPEDGLPVGLQLLGPHFDEALLLQVGDVAMRLAGMQE